MIGLISDDITDGSLLRGSRVDTDMERKHIVV